MGLKEGSSIHQAFLEAAGKLFPHGGRASLGPSSLLLVTVLPMGILWAKGRLSLWFVGVFPGCWLMGAGSLFTGRGAGQRPARLGECPGPTGSPADGQGLLWVGPQEGPGCPWVIYH